MENKLKRCPLCGGKIDGMERKETPMEIRTKATCTTCWMEFSYVQDFAYSKSLGRIAPLNASFEEAWNRRAGNGMP